MKKIILPVLLCAALIFTASCGNGSSDSLEADNSPSIADVDAENNAPQKEDIFGSIKEIVGNLATIELAVMSEDGIPVPGARRMTNFDPENMPEGFELSTNEDGSYNIPEGAQGRFNAGGNMPEGFQMSTNEDGGYNIPEGGQDIMTRGSGGNGGNGASFTFGDGQSVGGGPITRNEDGSITLADGSTISGDELGSRGQGGGFNTVFLDYTGEEIEFILPIGTPVYAVTKDEEGNQVETEIELGDIANNNVISVSYKADGKTIDKILVSQVTATKRPDGIPEGEADQQSAENNGGEGNE